MAAPAILHARVTKADYERADQLRERFQNLVLKKEVKVHWFDDNARFWYRNDLRESKEFIAVDAEEGARKPAFDHRRLAEWLSAATAKEYAADNLPFDSIEFVDDANAIRFEIEKIQWKFDLTTHECTRIGRVEEKEQPEKSDERRRGRRERDERESKSSPDGNWEAVFKDNNLYLRSTQDAREFRLSHNGEKKHYYSSASWSPYSRMIVAYRTEPGDNKKVYRVESSPEEEGRAKLHSNEYELPGDKMTSYEMSVFYVATKERTKVDTEPIDFGRPPRLRWTKDCRSFLFSRTDRGHERTRVIRVDANTGKTKTVVDEQSETFISLWWNGIGTRYLNDCSEIIWPSERDGWKHLYLYDGRTGKLKNQITKGAWVVRGIVHVDEENRTIFFRASGREKNRDPYLIHCYRINFDGTDLICLTPETGDHKVEFSPDHKYLVDTYSRVDSPPVHELRLASDGELICQLERADASALFEAGWKAPEPFVAKGRDGKTDIHGVIFRPMKLDESKKYPVIEDIYAGPHGSFVPKSWRDFYSAQSLAELGFIVVKMDGMGTNNRSKAFHDVCWKNLGDSGFPDRILWIKAAAKRYPYMDLTRVGIFGTSAGGQSSTRALLGHPDFYKVAVSSCGCHDNRMDKASWNEQWMGYPVGPHYAEQSNITNAGKLQGKLLLMVGELDRNVPPESTFRLVDALVKAGKDFDLLVLPGQGHTGGGKYGTRRRRDFFVRHLLGANPPDWNMAEGG
jgi:dipeptidyl aminopeptidase/acylaminoacyl peptidase